MQLMANRKDDFADTLETVNGCVGKREKERRGPKGGQSEGG